MERDGWSPERLAPKPTGSRTGWWGASTEVEAFLDELITWREIGFNRCANDDCYASYESLPEWARRTLADHENDPRPYTYDLADRLRSRGWQVPAYSMPPNRQDLVIQRILVRHGVSRDLASLLLDDMKRSLDFFTNHPVHASMDEKEAGGFKH